MESTFEFGGREVANQYMQKHMNIDVGDSSFGEFVMANKGKIDIQRNDSGEVRYVITDRKMIFYYDYFCSGNLVESLRDSKHVDERVLGVSDLNWFFNELRQRNAENKDYEF